jgi:hypothetical protein
MTDKQLISWVASLGVSAIIIGGIVIGVLLHESAPPPVPEKPKEVAVAPAPEPEYHPQSLQEWSRSHGGGSSDNSSEAGGIIVGVIVAVLIGLGIVLLLFGQRRSPWHLETLPDGQQVWVREPDPVFIFWW